MEERGWIARLRGGLARSSAKIGDQIGALFVKRTLDRAALDALEEILISADMGPELSARLVADFAKTRFGKDVTDVEIRLALAEQISKILEPCARPLEIDAAKKPFVILMVGVNGTGKTTTIGKMAHFYAGQGRKVMVAAADTFRAAATQQVSVWAQRANCEAIVAPVGGDAAALVYTAMEKAKSACADMLFIDTAGRLHTKSDLMQELAKIVRIVKKHDETAPHATLLVLDATVGQNAYAQMQAFLECASVTGLIITKLDGSAKGGVLVGLAGRSGLPIHAIGVGESEEDLRPFDAGDFARALMGVS